MNLLKIRFFSAQGFVYQKWKKMGNHVLFPNTVIHGYNNASVPAQIHFARSGSDLSQGQNTGTEE